MSKGLEALSDLWYGKKTTETYQTIEKELKAFAIIKEKGNFFSLEHDEYNDKYYIYDNELYMRNEITKEQYELLKEMFS